MLTLSQTCVRVAGSQRGLVTLRDGRSSSVRSGCRPPNGEAQLSYSRVARVCRGRQRANAPTGGQMGHYKSNLRDIEFNLFELLARDEVLGSAPFDEIDGQSAREILGQ